MCRCTGWSWLGRRTLGAGGIAVAGAYCSFFHLHPYSSKAFYNMELLKPGAGGLHFLKQLVLVPGQL
eukprot:972106-Pelagomonas_calceolata.AAC.1